MRTVFLLLAAAACASFASGLTLVESSQEGVTIELNAAQPVFGTEVIRGAQYTTVSMNDAENLAEAGLPRVPVYRTWIEIPIGATVEATVNELRVEEISHDGSPLVPAVLSASKDQPRDAFTVVHDPGVYTLGNPFPDSWVRVIYAGGMRGRNLALVEVMPLRWSPDENSFSLLAGASIELSFQGGDIARSYEQAASMACTEYERILQGTLMNYGTFEGGLDTPPAPYLIIGHSDFVDTAMDDFVAHKQALGFTVDMVDLSVTGTTADEIRAYIQNAITGGTVYVLLVGDTAFLPGGTATTYGDVTDLYYACLDDGGWIPDAFLGRFSVQTTGQCVTMAQRVIDYENSVGVQSWVQGAVFIASSDNSSVSEGTHNYCIETYLDPRGYNSTKVYPTQGGNAAQAVAAINAGASMLTFSGHGSQTSWGDMSFGSSDFNQLTNDGMFPGVLSHACLTGAYSTGTCWGETWTRTPERGGIYFWGSVPSSYWDEDDIQQRGEYESFLGNDVHWPKGYMNQGLMSVYTYYSGGGRSQYYYEGYTLFGDPSVITKTWPMTGIGEDHTAGVTTSPISVSAPNPVAGSIPVTLTGVSGPATVEIFDVTGRVIDRPFQNELTGQSVFTWDASSVSTGVYFIRLTQGGSIATARVSVIR